MLSPMEAVMPITQMFLQQSVDFLLGHYLPKIEQCLDVLTDEDLWWRPNEQSNSVGNLVLHLAGNIRQWIVSGLGGRPDTRKRDQEFDGKTVVPRAGLKEKLRSVMEEAGEVLRSLDPEMLSGKRPIQQKEVSVLYAVYHVVEHCSMHTGQILYITKERTAKNLGFYGFEKGKPVERWRGKID